MLYSDLKARIRDLVDDPSGEYTTDDYLLNKVAVVYDDLYNDLRSTGAQFDESVVELINVTAGTPDLGAYFASGKDLEMLLNPTRMDAKLTGLDPINYLQVTLTSRLEDLQPGATIGAFEWRRGNIYITPATAAMDIRIRGEFLFSALKEDADPIEVGKNMGSYLAYKAASLIGIVRGNPQWEKSYGLLGDRAFDSIAIQIVKADQGKVKRVGRVSRRGAPNLFNINPR